MKLLAYTDGKTDSIRALHFAAALKVRLGAELAVITVRSGTHATEIPPPLGVDIPSADFRRLPKGLRILTDAARVLAEGGLIPLPSTVVIQDTPHGHMFPCKTETGDRVLFYECFGHFIEALNHEIDKHDYQLLIISPPRRNGLQRILATDASRQLALDLHASFLVVRGGGPDSRYLICADGSPSSKRQFPLLKQLLPAIRTPVDILWVRDPQARPHQIHDAEECLKHASDWLEACKKKGPFIIIDYDAGIPFFETQSGPLYLIFIHNDESVSSLISPQCQNLLPILISHGDTGNPLIHSQTDSRPSFFVGNQNTTSAFVSSNSYAHRPFPFLVKDSYSRPDFIVGANEYNLLVRTIDNRNFLCKDLTEMPVRVSGFGTYHNKEKKR